MNAGPTGAQAPHENPEPKRIHSLRDGDVIRVQFGERRFFAKVTVGDSVLELTYLRDAS